MMLRCRFMPAAAIALCCHDGTFTFYLSPPLRDAHAADIAMMMLLPRCLHC